MVLAAAGAYVAGLAVVALWPVPVDRGVDVLGSWPVRLLVKLGLSPARGYDVVQLSANVVLFVPLGFFAMLLVRASVPMVVLGGAVVSAAVELVQAEALPERVASWPDVVANTLGAAVGAVLAVWVRRRARRPIRRG